MERKTDFKEELRKSLINHALLPFLLLVFVVVLIITVSGFSFISKKNNDAVERFSNKVEKLIKTYILEANEISKRIEVDNFCNNMVYRTKELTKIYHFFNNQQIKGEFYLLDDNFEVIFGTMGNKVLKDYLLHHLKMKKNDEKFWKNMEFIYDDYNLLNTAPSCVIFRKISSKSRVIGYVGFIISAEHFPVSKNNENLFLLISNRFNRVFSVGGEIFCNARGKLKDVYKSKGFSYENLQYYYVSYKSALKGYIKIYVISDCTIFIHIVLLSSIILCLLSCVEIGFIYMSAGKIAKKKTDIMYELIEALREVKKGNFNTTLDIKSGDEFEMMGNTFNMMQESIKKLLIRQQELTKQNTTSMIHTLESQFNPHFLFNTLESIRYMIRENKDSAESMIVKLSKLLRYSIQNSDKMVILAEELEFADKYLKIMLYRYGERLQYNIDINEEFHEIEIPRMILQPILENSIKYGYGKNKILKIDITAHTREDGVEIQIDDNGRGIETELLSKLKESLDYSHNYSVHIGIHNVHRRLRLIYGENYGLTVESSKDRGTSVRLFVPYIWEGKNIAENIDCRR